MEEWLKILTNVQDRIEVNAPIRYKTQYRPSELSYWAPCAQWMYYDSLENNPKTIIDIGVGYGTLAAYARELYGPGVEIYCVDATPRHCQPGVMNEFNLDFILEDIETGHSFQNSKFDRIIFTEIMEHLYYHPSFTLRKINKMLRHNGLCYLSTPDAEEWGRTNNYYPNIDSMPDPESSSVAKPSFDEVDDHIYQYTRQEVEENIFKSDLIPVAFDYSGKPRHLNYLITKRGA